MGVPCSLLVATESVSSSLPPPPPPRNEDDASGSWLGSYSQSSSSYKESELRKREERNSESENYYLIVWQLHLIKCNPAVHRLLGGLLQLLEHPRQLDALFLQNPVKKHDENTNQIELSWMKLSHFALVLVYLGSHIVTESSFGCSPVCCSTRFNSSGVSTTRRSNVLT